MICLDTTNARRWKHGSGLSRVSARLGQELGSAARAVAWPDLASQVGPSDWLLTPELFSEEERPGFRELLRKRPFRAAAVYHDAIPIKHPSITWPASVRRHPEYMKLLSEFDRVWAVSPSSREELIGFWKWQGILNPPAVDVLSLGSDLAGVPRGRGAAARESPPRIVSVGILEPRKNQTVLLDAFEVLRGEGLAFELHLVGRVNPHYGERIADRVRDLRAGGPGLFHHDRMDDKDLADLVRSAHATAFASIAEGCGLPQLESLWMGVPCLCSDIPALVGNAEGGGCAIVPGNSLAGWISAFRKILTDEAHRARLDSEAASRALPTWSGAADSLRAALS
jgi:glycosyltransferase involved in cell wall biosynthesis